MNRNLRQVICEDFWISQLKGFEAFAIPSNASEETSQDLFLFPKFINDRLIQLSKGISTNSYALLFAGLSILLARYMEKRDILLATPKFLDLNYQETHEKSQIIFLRLQVEQDTTIRSILQNIQIVIKAAHKHQDCDFDALLKRYCLDNNGNLDTLFQIGFSYSKLNQTSLLSSGVKLLFQVQEDQEAYSLLVRYKNKAFSKAIINQMSAHFFRTLEFVLWQPDSLIGKIELLSDDEQTMILEKFNDTQTLYPQDKLVIDLFEEQVKQNPNAVAIVCEKNSLSYQDLNRQANRIAAYLQTQGIGAEHRIGLLLTRSEYLIIGILGILKAGGAYLPIDPELPIERIQYMVEDSDCQIILSEDTQRNIWDLLKAVHIVNIKAIEHEYDVIPQTKSTDSRRLAYLMYTSGSTGLPKGVAIEHRSLMNYLYWANNYYFATDPTLGNMALFTSPAFDLTVTTIFLPLLRGKKLYIYQDSPEVILEKCFREDSKIDTIKLTPSHIQILKYIPVAQSNIKLVIVGGEELRVDHVQLLKERGAEMRIYNEYGPTEATVGCVVAEANIENITIGKPIANTQIYILSEEFQLQPIGVVGEICIGGDCLARCYWNRQELTQEKFVKHPFSSQNYIYRTGDLGRWSSQGQLEYLGRKDSQVKIGGYRIEISEIEQQLLQYSEINEVAILTKIQENNKELIAYIVGSAKLHVADVQTYLAQKLPAYMIPQHIIFLEKLPLMANGKLDRKALAKLEESKRPVSNYEAPRTLLESQIIEIVTSVLKLEKIGIHESLLTLGANSLKIIQIVSRLRRFLGVELNLKDVFANPTVRGLAKIVQTKQQIDLPDIKKIDIAPHYSLSYAQRQFWISAQMGISIAYNIPGAVLIEGDLNKQALKKAFTSIVTRHEVFRTNFIYVDAEPRQRISQNTDICFKEWDLSLETDPNANAQSIIQQEIARPFDLENDSLLRIYLLQLTEAQHLLIINVHHIIFDGWSIGLLLKELTTLYEAYNAGKENILQPLEFQYKDYAVWQNNLLNSEQILSVQNYWHQKLRDVQPLSLPTDYVRPAIQAYNGSVIPLKLPNHFINQIEQFSQEHQVSQFVIFLTVLKTLLYRYTGNVDIIVGTPVSERTQLDWENQIGLYLNTIILRDKISPQNKFSELLQNIKKNALEAFGHQNYPFEKLVQELDIKRDPSRNPIFDVGYTWMDEIGSQLERITLKHLKVTQISLETQQKSAVTDLWFYFEKRSDSIEGYITYNCNLFKEETVYLFKQAFINILEQVLKNHNIQIKTLNFINEEKVDNIQVNQIDIKLDF